MIRQYDLTKYRGSYKVLYCEVRRFLRDVPFVLRYYFDSGRYEISAPASWTSRAIGCEVTNFVELINSPHWLAEIQPNLIQFDERCLF